MRVNPNNTPDMLNLLSQTTQRQQDALQQLASGRRVNKPSDDPAAAATMTDLLAESADNDQFVRNIDSVQQTLSTADSALSSVVTSLQRAITLGVQGATGTLSAADRQAVAADVQGIKDQILGLANTAFHGNYVFAGTATTQPPFVADATQFSGIAYQGNTGTDSVPIGENRSTTINTPGSSIFTQAGADVFGALQSLISSLQSNDVAGVTTANSQLNAAFNHVTASRVFYGNTMNHLTADQTVLQTNAVQIANQQNSAVGADLAATVSALSQAQTARQAILAATAKTSGQSLLDYLQ
jgi:flagellar hook-associated protein 3 FlgL